MQNKLTDVEEKMFFMFVIQMDLVNMSVRDFWNIIALKLQEIFKFSLSNMG